MSKPKPGLGKGLVRNLTITQYHHHPHHVSSSSGIITLAPVIGQHGYSTGSSGVGSGKNSNNNNVSNGWPSSSSSSSSSAISLLPTWDQLNEIVLPYTTPSPRTRLKSSSSTSSTTYNGIVRNNQSRKYSSLAISSSAFLTSPIPPSLFFDKSLSFQSQSIPQSNNQIHSPIPTPLSNSTSPAQISLEALLNSLESSSFNSSSKQKGSFDNLPPPDQPPHSPSRGSSPSQQQPTIKSRSIESHTVLSPNPLSISEDNYLNSNQSISYTNSLLSSTSSSSKDYSKSTENSPEEISNSTYSSTLIFHLGCSGLAKERLPIPSSSRRSRPPTPPRQRSFPLPEVEIPTSLKSIGVGEDAYFARSDGLCIADGVGGWSRSTKGSADAGRWSRLLTHFVEEELSDWWVGKEYYLTPKSNKGKGKEEVSLNQEKKKEQQQQKKQGWARESWENKSGVNSSSASTSRSMSSTTNLANKNSESSNSASSIQVERERRPLDPVEIMQRGFEKCLACINTEGIHGSSTCLLALLHNSTLHIANLGDCCLLLIRKGEVVFRTQEMQHAFNFPLQVGTHSRDEPMKDAQRYDVPVKKGDVVILGSDGLMDNLFDEDILEIVLQFSSSSEPSPTSTSNSSKPFPPFSPQQISETLCRRARSVSELVTATTPFMCKAIEEGIDFVGGKKDDISVLVGVIGDRESVQNNGGEGKEGGLKLHL